MTDVQGGEAADAGAAPEAAVLSQETERDYDTEARDTGWRPKEEWTGKPENWKDAKTWVEHGDLRTSIRNEVRAEVKAEYDGRFKRLERMSEKTVKQQKEHYEQQIADLKAGRSEAIKKGDEKLVERYDTAIEKAKEAAKDDGTGAAPDADVEAEFVTRNEWYGKDEELTALAERHSRLVAEAYFKEHGKPMPYELNLKQVEEKVKASALWKSKNEKPAANGHAAVDGGSDSPAAAGKPTLFSKLPPEAKAQCAKDVKAGLYPNNEAWAKVFLDL